jgi:hypothetical protein
MKLKSYLVPTTALVGLFTLTLAPLALAGEGGIAGAASFILDGSEVEEASVAVAVGKSTAYAGASTDVELGTEAFAVGTGGDIDVSDDSIYLSDVYAENAGTLDDPQENNINNNSIDIDITDADGYINTEVEN